MINLLEQERVLGEKETGVTAYQETGVIINDDRHRRGRSRGPKSRARQRCLPSRWWTGSVVASMPSRHHKRW